MLLERQRVEHVAQLGEAQVSHLAAQVVNEQQRVEHVRQMSEAQASHLIGQVGQLQAQVQVEAERVAHVTQLSEAQASHLVSVANASTEEAARERARALNCEHISAASDRQLGEACAEMGAQLTSQLNACELNARDEVNQIAASERKAVRRAELVIASHEARESQEEHAASL